VTGGSDVGEAADDSADAAVARLLRLLELETLEVDLFRGYNPNTWPGGRVFGGLVASQAVRAAMATVDADHRIHSLHGYFLRPGEPGLPIVFTVDRIRDGRSFTSRHVMARQRGEVIFDMSSSFHRDGEEGIDYQLPIPPDSPPPGEVDDRTGGFPVRSTFFQPFDLRDIGPTPPEPDGTFRSTRRVWVKTAAPLPDDPAIHAAVLTFMSDMAVVMAVRPPTKDSGAPPWERFTGASIDHAVWFHRPIRADDWLFYDLHALSNFNARGLARGVFYTRDGVLGASITQEALVRQVRPGTPPSGTRSVPPEL
jgi:acyl-CoA thioesterase-2